MVDGSTRDQVNEYSGNKFKFAIKSDKIDFLDRNFVFLDEYSLSGQRGPYLTTEVKFSQIRPSQFFLSTNQVLYWKLNKTHTDTRNTND